MATNLIQQFGLNSYGWYRITQGTLLVWLVEDYSRNITVKLLSKYLQSDTNKGLTIWLSGRGAGFLSKKIFWFLICKKKIKWLKRGTKKIIWPQK